MIVVPILVTLSGVVVVHALSMRFAWGGSSVGRFLWIGGSGAVVLGGWLTNQESSGATLMAALAMYAFACELYLFLFTLVISSVSVQVLLSLREGSMTLRDLTEREGGGAMVDRRLDRMIAVGLLERDGKALRITRAGHRLRGAFRRLRRWFRPGGCGIDRIAPDVL